MGFFDGLLDTGKNVLGSLVGGIFGSEGQEDANNANQAMAREQMQFQERMSNTSYQRGVTDMRKAGLNPMLAYTQGGASVPQGATAVMGNKNSAAMQSAANAAAVANTIAQTDLLEAQKAKTEAETGLVAAQVGQTTASAGNLEAQRDKIRQEMQAWMEVNRERAFIARDKEWYEGSIARSKSDEESVKADVELARAQASRLKAQAKLLNLEVPGALNDAAFESSEYGKSYRYLDKGLDQLGKGASSVSAVKRFTGR